MRIKNFFIFAIVIITILADDPIHSCPKYSCEKGTNKNCALVKAGLATDGFNRISLAEVCDNGESCDVPSPSFKTLADIPNDTGFTCKINIEPTNKILRFPGEKCYTNEDCLKTDEGTGICSSGHCTGIEEKHVCNTTAGCLAGLYCNTTFKRCFKQKEDGDECSSSSECANHLLCHRNKCQFALFSLESGTELDEDDANFNDYKCKFGLHWFGKCVSMVQELPGDKDGFVECNYGETCHYKYGNEQVYREDCACGFNAEGKGYCPLGYNKRENDLTIAFNKLANSFKNNCHSLSRANCYEQSNSSDVISFNQEIKKFTKAHLLHGAVPCADAVLGGNFVSFSMMIVALFITLLF
jgi:hypothetical protein